jgi:hypothetical protein
MGFLSETETAVQGLAYIMNTSRNEMFVEDAQWRLENLLIALENYEGARAYALRAQIEKLLGIQESQYEDTIIDGLNNTFCGFVALATTGVALTGLWAIASPIFNVIRY